MCLTGTLLRNVLVFLLFVDACSKRRCNYREILGSYREVIFIELQNLNLTDSFNTSKVRDSCPSGKILSHNQPEWLPHIKDLANAKEELSPHRILVSIYGMTLKMRCQRSSKRTSDLEKPVASMEQLIIQNCSPNYLGKTGFCSGSQKIRGKKRKRIWSIKVIKSLITCWQKLQSVFMLSK